MLFILYMYIFHTLMTFLFRLLSMYCIVVSALDISLVRNIGNLHHHPSFNLSSPMIEFSLQVIHLFVMQVQ